MGHARLAGCPRARLAAAARRRGHARGGSPRGAPAASRAREGYARAMIRALVAVARSIALAHDRWRSRAAPRRPMLVELSVINERLARMTAERDLLRARLRRVPARSRPHYRGFERLAILEHGARHGL